MQVFQGSLWHENCDPFCSVIALTLEACEKALNDCAEEEWDRLVDEEAGEHEHSNEVDYDGFCSICDKIVIKDDIKTGGIFKEEFDIFNLSPEQINELQIDGVIFLE